VAARALITFAIAMAACKARSDNPNIRTFAGSDLEMRAAIDSARSTVGMLLRRLERPSPASQTFLSVKVRFGDDRLGEHIWLDSLSFDGRRLHGQLQEDAVAVSGLHAGQWVSASPDSISDWLIIDRGIACGGFTMRVDRSRATVADRAALDSGLTQLGFVRWGAPNSC